MTVRTQRQENGNGRVTGFVVKNVETGEIIDDGFGHFKVYSSAQSAKRKASAMNNAPIYPVKSWKVFAVTVSVAARPIQ